MVDRESTPAAASIKFALSEKWDGSIITGSPSGLLSTLTQMQRVLHRAAAASPGPLLLDITGCSSIDPGGILLVMYVGSRLKDLGWSPYLRTTGPVQKLVMKHLTHYLLPKERRKEASPSKGEY